MNMRFALQIDKETEDEEISEDFKMGAYRHRGGGCIILFLFVFDCVE